MFNVKHFYLIISVVVILLIVSVCVKCTHVDRDSAYYIDKMVEATVYGKYRAGVRASKRYNSMTDSYKIDFDDIYWLSRLVYAEVGADWMPDELQHQVASVVLNRVAHDYYADTVKDVIFEKINGVYQYQPARSGSIKRNPNERAVRNALYVLINGSVFDDSVLTQGPYIYGDIHAVYRDPILGSVIYFCEISTLQ